MTRLGLPAAVVGAAALVAAPSLLTGPNAIPTAQANELTIIHINVGQGDSTLILGPEVSGRRVAVLMDAGDIPMSGDPDGGRIVGAVLQQRGVGDLDYFIASHYDADHIGGAVAGSAAHHGHSFILGGNNVPGSIGDDDSDGDMDWLDADATKPDPDELGTSDDIRIGTFVDRGDSSPPSSKTYKKYVAMAKAMGTRVSLDSQAEVDSFEIDLGGGATMTCLAANGFVRARGSKVRYVNTENERSLCFLVAHGGFHYLIGGDMIGRKASPTSSENAKVEKAVGEYLSGQGIAVDVLHVGHHGANNASEAEFLRLIAPEVAIISVGSGNGYGHPNTNALNRLVDADVYRIYQTNWGSPSDGVPESVRRRQAIFQGDIVITTNGQTYEVSTSREFEVDG